MRQVLLFGLFLAGIYGVFFLLFRWENRQNLDRELRAVNSDYDAKRRTTLERQRLTVVDRGLFLAWLRARGKNKVPRLVNDRRVADEILAFGGETK